MIRRSLARLGRSLSRDTNLGLEAARREIAELRRQVETLAADLATAKSVSDLRREGRI